MAGNGGPLDILGLSAQWNSLSSKWMADTQSMAISLGVLFTFFFMWNQAACALFRAMGFKNQKVVYELGSCASSVIHCTVVSVLTYQELCNNGWGIASSSPSFDLAGENSPTGLATMCFCISYMLADLAYLHRHSPGDTLYIVHHWATVVYMCLCVMAGRGHLSTMLCIFLGEVTGPINNGMVITNLIITESRRTKGFLVNLNYFFAILLWIGFFFIRILYAPWGVCWFIGSFYLGGGGGSESIPMALRIVWVALPVLVEYGSFTFFFDLFGHIRRGATCDVVKEQLASKGKKA